MAKVISVRPVIGMEIHVELATRTKMFSRVPNPAHPDAWDAEPNTLIDPVVLGLPGSLPVINGRAVELAARVGLALGCTIATTTKWDRKSYFYPDLPKNYQISQYDMPLCFDGRVELPAPRSGEGATKSIRIIRAHLEEDAGKLLHEWPGGRAIDFSIVDLNRAGTPLLEIVTAPDFESADEAVAFAQLLRNTCRFLGVSECVMQKGHIRFEPNINAVLVLDDGREVRTPIVEVKNLNSFRSLRGAIEFELAEQPRRFLADGREHGPGMKQTRGWDDVREATFAQREKEEADDYRYFPDPDLPPVKIGAAEIERWRRQMPELPAARAARYRRELGLSEKEASTLVEERGTCELFDGAVEEALSRGVERARAARWAINIVLQSGLKRANDTGRAVHELGISAARIGEIVALRQENLISAQGADQLFGALCERDEDARAAAERLGLLQVRDEGALDAWVQAVIDDPANAKAVADVRAGKDVAIGRLVGAVMKLSAGKADAAAAKEKLAAKLK